MKVRPKISFMSGKKKVAFTARVPSKKIRRRISSDMECRRFRSIEGKDERINDPESSANVLATPQLGEGEERKVVSAPEAGP